MCILKVSIISLIENVKAPALVVCAVWGTGNLTKEVDMYQKHTLFMFYIIIIFVITREYELQIQRLFTFCFKVSFQPLRSRHVLASMPQYHIFERQEALILEWAYPRLYEINSY